MVRINAPFGELFLRQYPGTRFLAGVNGQIFLPFVDGTPAQSIQISQQNRAFLTLSMDKHPCASQVGEYERVLG